MLGQYTEQRLYIVPRRGCVCSNSTCTDFLRENQPCAASSVPPALPSLNSVRLCSCALHDRLEIGDISLVVAISSPHRADAFAACKYVVDRIKQVVPIWKKEFFEDGEVWVGSEAEHHLAGSG